MGLKYEPASEPLHTLPSGDGEWLARPRRTDPSNRGTARPTVYEPQIRTRLEEQLLYINVQRFRGGLVFKAHRLVPAGDGRRLARPRRIDPANRARGRST